MSAARYLSTEVPHREADAKAGILLSPDHGRGCLAAAVAPEPPEDQDAAPDIHKALQGIPKHRSTAGCRPSPGLLDDGKGHA